MKAQAAAIELPLAVVDLETTGISPRLHDRVLEVAVVRLEPGPSNEWRIAGEFVTLVNPGRDVGAVGVHHISAAEISTAPAFADVAGDIAAQLDGAVVAGHNLRFDVTFLQAEYSRIDLQMPESPGLCTLRLAHRIYPQLPSRKLAHLCEEAGIRHEDGHSALDDARATAHLLVHLLDEDRRGGWDSLQELARSWRPAKSAAAWAPPPSGRTVSRGAAAERIRRDRGYLARLVERLPGTAGSDWRTVEYLAVLDRALEDRLLTRAEADGLLSFALAAGLTRGQVLDLHRDYLARLVEGALYDGVVSEAERQDLELVCDVLGLPNAALSELLSRPATTSEATVPTDTLRGKTVCFTGELTSSYRGEPMTRDLAHRLATEAGMVVAESVTKRLDVLVVADPHTASSKAAKARRYGTRILAAASLWQALRIQVD